MKRFYLYVCGNGLWYDQKESMDGKCMREYLMQNGFSTEDVETLVRDATSGGNTWPYLHGGYEDDEGNLYLRYASAGPGEDGNCGVMKNSHIHIMREVVPAEHIPEGESFSHFPVVHSETDEYWVWM